jgi:hypothetical protein
VPRDGFRRSQARVHRVQAVSLNGKVNWCELEPNDESVRILFLPEVRDIEALPGEADVERQMIDLKQRQRQAWQAGDYRTIGAKLQIVSETLCEAVDLRGGQAVLDVAAGTGNTAIAAARGGKIGMANWTPSGFIGAVFRTISQMDPPPEGVRPPILWGTEAHLQQLFGDRVTLRVNKRHFMVRFLSPGHWIEVASTMFGPLLKAFEVLDDSDRERLVRDLREVANAFNQADDGTVVAPSEYLELVGTKA